MNILFYTPFAFRSRDTESLMINFRKSGHNVFYVSQVYGQEIQELLSDQGIHVFNSIFKQGFTKINFIREIFFLIRFCRKNRINVVFSHLEPAHFIAVLVQYFIKANVFVCRHHVNELHLSGKDKLFSYKLTYKLGRHFIVVSQRAKDFMVTAEGVKPEKIDTIRLAYDFSLYPRPDEVRVQKIRAEFPCDILLITACRLIKDKRPDLSVDVLRNLVNSGISAKLLILGSGDSEEMLQGKILNEGLEKSCFLLGRLDNILDYLKASDLLLHPSIADSSSVIVKEAGLVNKPVIVCAGVGDCDEYIQNMESGIIVSKDRFVDESCDFLKIAVQEKNKLETMGKRLNKVVLNNFSIENNIKNYDKYLKI
ncbi:MAG TPA: glycosyltransferase [Cytophagaceae bacterium]|jgi:glycosyltransferase involved in cell wall biosynthesis|nr:glycosyltransferase [Cytophagaceae bacterium]